MKSMFQAEEKKELVRKTGVVETAYERGETNDVNY